MPVGFKERRACPVCDVEDADILCEMEWREAELSRFIESFYRGRVPLAEFGESVYRVRRCRHCGMLYQDPILDDDGMFELYERWIDADRSLRKKRDAADRLRRKFAGQLQTVARLFADRRADAIRLLDYGMGWGYWCVEAQARGFTVSGYELSSSRRAHARGLGVDVIDSLNGTGEAFDFILASQVFEHLPEPRVSLRQLADRLAPGGIIHLRVPDGRGVESGLRRYGWSPLLDAVHPLEHINCFTRKTLLDLADSAGLRAFDPPLRLSLGSLGGGIKREIRDRWLTTHLHLRRR